MTRRFADERSAALQACRISIPKESSVGYRLFQDEIPVTTLLGLPTQTWTPPSTALTVSRSDRMAAIPLMGMVDMPQEYVTSLAPRTLCCPAQARPAQPLHPASTQPQMQNMVPKKKRFAQNVSPKTFAQYFRTKLSHKTFAQNFGTQTLNNFYKP